MDTLSVRVLGSGEVRLVINGFDLIDLAESAHAAAAAAEGRYPDRYEGLRAGQVLPPSHHLIGGPDEALVTENGKPFLLGCSCGVPSCGPLAAVIDITGATVTWRDFEQPFLGWNYEGFGPFTFSRKRYQYALNHPTHI